MESVLEHILTFFVFKIYHELRYCLKNVVNYRSNLTKLDLHVIHKSSNYLILNKEHDILINSNEPTIKTLHYKLCKYYPSLVNPKLQHGFYFIHRLDYATSGVICVALHKKACSAASTAFQTRTTEKYYLALLRGHVSTEFIEIDISVGEDSREIAASHRMCTVDDDCCVCPRDAFTRLLVLQRGLFDGYPATKVLLRPTTGRRHQLRVHCSHIGHTIVGDFTYSRRKDVRPPRTFLHALRLVLPNAVEPIDVMTPDPFTSDCLRNWTPVETVNFLDGWAFEKINREKYHQRRPPQLQPPKNGCKSNVRIESHW